MKHMIRHSARGHDYMLTYLRAHKELSASPRNPNVPTVAKSANSLILDVQCFRATHDIVNN